MPWGGVEGRIDRRWALRAPADLPVLHDLGQWDATRGFRSDLSIASDGEAPDLRDRSARASTLLDGVRPNDLTALSAAAVTMLAVALLSAAIRLSEPAEWIRCGP